MNFFNTSYNCYTTNFFLHHVVLLFYFLNHSQQYYKNLKMRRDLMLKIILAPMPRTENYISITSKRRLFNLF